MPRIPDLCDQLLDAHRGMNRALADSFAPGLTDELIDDHITGLPLNLPKAVRELFKWRNGVPWSADLDRRFIEYMEFWPLADVVDEYKMRRETRDASDFRPQWVPLFNDAYGESWVVDCAGGIANGRVIVFFNEVPNDKMAFRSVEQCLATMIAAFKARAFSDVNGNLQTDRKRFCEVARAMNPDAKSFWSNPNSYGAAAAE